MLPPQPKKTKAEGKEAGEKKAKRKAEGLTGGKGSEGAAPPKKKKKKAAADGAGGSAVLASVQHSPNKARGQGLAAVAAMQGQLAGAGGLASPPETAVVRSGEASPCPGLTPVGAQPTGGEGDPPPSAHKRYEQPSDVAEGIRRICQLAQHAERPGDEGAEGARKKLPHAIREALKSFSPLFLRWAGTGAGRRRR